MEIEEEEEFLEEDYPEEEPFECEIIKYSDNLLLNDWLKSDMEAIRLMEQEALIENSKSLKEEKPVKSEKTNTTNVMLPVFTGGAIKVKEKPLPTIKNAQIHEMKALIEKREQLEQQNQDLQVQIARWLQKNSELRAKNKEAEVTLNEFLKQTEEKQQAIRVQLELQRIEMEKRTKERKNSSKRISQVQQSIDDLKSIYKTLSNEIPTLEDQLQQIVLMNKLKISELLAQIKKVSLENAELIKHRQEIEKSLILTHSTRKLK